MAMATAMLVMGQKGRTDVPSITNRFTFSESVHKVPGSLHLSATVRCQCLYLLLCSIETLSLLVRSILTARAQHWNVSTQQH